MLKEGIRTLNEIIFQNNARNYSAATAIVVMLIGFMTLAGWQFDIYWFKHPVTELVPMNPMAAVALICAAISLLLLIYAGGNNRTMVFGKFFGVCTVAIGVLKLLFVFTGFDVGLDHWLFKQEIFEDLVNNKPNRIGATSALNLVFVGSCLLLFRVADKHAILISNVFVVLTAAVALLSIVGFTYGAHAISEIRPFIPMAFHTAMCFLLISIGIFCAEPDRGIMAMISGPYRGGQIIQLLLPMAIFLPLAFGLLRLYGERSGLFTNSLGTALFATVNVLIFIALIFKTASSLNSSDKVLMKEIDERRRVEKELKENNIFLDAIFQNTPSMIFVKEAKELRFVQLNLDGEKILGFRKHEIIGKNDQELFPKEQAEYLNKTDRKLFEDKVLLDIPEEKLTTRSGDRWLHTKKIPIIDENGVPQYLVGISEDITELKAQNDQIQEFYKELEHTVQVRTEQLYKSEQRFKALLENSIDAISLTDRNGEIIYQSPSVERMTGYSLLDQEQHKLSEFLHQEDRKHVREVVLDLLHKPGTSVPILFRLQHKNGHFIWIEGTVTNLLQDKSVQAVVYNFRDITEKKLAEEALALSEEKYRLLFSNNPLPAWVFDTQTLAFLEVNDAAIVHYGYSREEFFNMTIKEIRPEEDIDALMQRRTQPGESDTVIYNGYWRHLKKNGEIIYVDISSRHINFKGRIGRLVIAHDVTDKLEAEQRLNEANQTLSLRAKELSASNKELEQFAYVASHDLQEPLRMVSSFLQLLEKKYKDLLDDTGRQYIHFAVDGAERMKRLILDLLAYSRTGTSKELSAAIDMNEIARDVASTFTFAMKESGGEIIVKELPVITAVKSQMQQLLQNLVSNGIKYRGQDPPRIVISSEENEAYWIFRVTDNGLGIDSRFFEKIFIIFQRLHNKTEYSGTGIGLAICKKIVERHGGTIHVESEPGKGSTFVFSIKKI